jgi:hypothetical protein
VSINMLSSDKRRVAVISANCANTIPT